MISGFIIMALPFISIISAIAYLPFALYITKRLGRQTFLYHLVRFAFIGYLLSLIYLTLLWYYPDITFQPEYYFLNLKPFIWVREVYDMGIKKMYEQLILNVGMFIPYGLLLPMAIKNARNFRTVSLIVLFSTIGIEVIQYFMGRSADIDDVIMNFLGGIIGYLLFIIINKLFKNKGFWKGITNNRMVSD
ncbi:MAG: VanZ family protein [Lachnospiraceae bacterium]